MPLLRFNCSLLARSLPVWLVLLLPAVASAVDSEAVARRLLNSQGCKACHLFESEGDAPAPDLTKVGSRLKREQIHGWLITPDHRHASGRIADFSHLSGAEIDALVTFLSQRQ